MPAQLSTILCIRILSSARSNHCTLRANKCLLLHRHGHRQHGQQHLPTRRQTTPHVEACVPSSLVSLALRPRRMTPACIKAWTASLNPATVWHCWIATGADIQAMAVKTSACTTEHYPLHQNTLFCKEQSTARCGQTHVYCCIETWSRATWATASAHNEANNAPRLSMCPF